MPSTRRSKLSPRSSSSASRDRIAAQSRLEALLRDRLGLEVARIASVIVEILVAEGWTPPPQLAPPSAEPGDLPAATALFDAARAGGADAVCKLLDLPVEALRRLIGELGYDPSRRARKWTDRDRLIAFITDETVKRVRRNRAFLSMPAAAPAPVDVATTEVGSSLGEQKLQPSPELAHEGEKKLFRPLETASREGKVS